MIDKLDTGHVTEGDPLNAQSGADLSDASADSFESEEEGGEQYGADLDPESSIRMGGGQCNEKNSDRDEAFRTDPLLLLQKLALQVLLEAGTDIRP